MPDYSHLWTGTSGSVHKAEVRCLYCDESAATSLSDLCTF